MRRVSTSAEKTVLEEHEGGDERGDVGVHDGPERLVEAGGHGSARRLGRAQLLADALEDDHVGVHGHAHGEHDARDAGQRERRFEHRHDAREQQQVGEQRAARVDAREPVVADGEHHHHDQAEDRGAHSPGDRVRAQRRPHGALLFDLHGNRQGAGPQHHRQVRRLLRREATLDLSARPDARADDRRAVDPLVEHDREPLADVGAGEVAEDLRPLDVEGELHDGALLAVEIDARVLEIIARDRRRLLQQIRREDAIRLLVALEGDDRLLGQPVRVTREQQLLGLVRIRDDLELQEARDAQQLTRAAAVDLAAGNLHQDAIVALARHHGVRDAAHRIGDASAQHFQHLAHAALPHTLPHVAGQRVLERRAVVGQLPEAIGAIGPIAHLGGIQLGSHLHQHARALRALHPLYAHGGEGELLFLGPGLQILPEDLQLLLHGHVELGAQHPVDAALQVESEAQPAVRQEGVLQTRLLGHEVADREEGEQPDERQRRADAQAQPAHASSPSFLLFCTWSTRARAILTRIRSPLTPPTSTVSTSSVTPVTLPCSPPAVTTLSPFSMLLSIASCCRWRFCCGRISRK
jgi:hypothetical protein